MTIRGQEPKRLEMCNSVLGRAQGRSRIKGVLVVGRDAEVLTWEMRAQLPAQPQKSTQVDFFPISIECCPVTYL